MNLYTYCANNPLIYYDPTGNTYVPLEVPTQYVNKHYNSVKAYDLAWRKQTDKDFAKRVELGEIIDRKMRSDKSAENIVLGSSQLEHEAILFLQDQVYVHGQQALEVTVEQLLESKRLYLKTGDKIYLTLFKNAYVDYVASKNTYSELGFEIKNGFVKDENYYETLYNIYYRKDNFKEWLLLERNLQTLFSEAQNHINSGIQIGSTGVLKNMSLTMMESSPFSNVKDSGFTKFNYDGFEDTVYYKGTSNPASIKSRAGTVTTNAEKGALGEEAADLTMSRVGYIKLPSKVGSNNGFDGVYIKYGPNGEIQDIIINESKFGTSKLGKTVDGYKQMGPDWIDMNISKMKQSKDAEVRNTAKILEENIDIVRTKLNRLTPNGINKWKSNPAGWGQ